MAVGVSQLVDYAVDEAIPRLIIQVNVDCLEQLDAFSLLLLGFHVHAWSLVDFLRDEKHHGIDNCGCWHNLALDSLFA